MLQSALDYLVSTGQNADYQTWLHVGMALKDKYGDSGYPMWLDWSRQNYADFDECVCQTKWKSFKRNGVGWGPLLIGRARQGGDRIRLPMASLSRSTPRPNRIPKSAPEPDPEPTTAAAPDRKTVLIIYSGDLPATAKVLARLFADNDTFFDNGNAPVRCC